MAYIPDPKDWAKSYVRNNLDACIAYSKEACVKLEEHLHARSYAAAVKELDNAANGLIAVANTGLFAPEGVKLLKSSVSFLSAVEAMIFLDEASVREIEQTVGMIASDTNRRKVILGELQDARDFSDSRSLQEVYSNCIRILERGGTFASAQQELAPDYPEEAYYCISTVIQHM